jgi:hypothetical protein
MARRIEARTTAVLVFLLALAATLHAQPGLPAISINDVTLDESECANPSFVFTVTLTHLGRPVTVNYATSDGLPSGIGTAAVGGKDYVSVSGTLTFDHSSPANGPRGSYVRTITVPLGNYVASSSANDGRAFTVTLSGATNATIVKAKGTGTLLDAATSCASSQNSQCFVNFCGATTACKNVNRSATATPLCELANIDRDFSACNAAGLWRDSDGDGLSDAAETQGYIDNNANGVYDPGIDIPLPGADPNKADVYLHYDYVVAADHSHQPPAEAIQWIVDSFAAHGISLHIDPQHNAIDETSAQVVTLGAPGSGDTDPACAGPSAISVKELRAKYPALAVLKPAYHYMVFAHYASTPTGGGPYTCPSDPETPACGALVSGPPQPGNTGTAEIFGDDSIVASQPFVDAAIVPDIGSIPLEWWAGLGMHEFGHNLGLLHGGQDCFNNKPNYLSAMSYSFYLNGIRVSAAPGDTIPKSCNADSDCLSAHASGAHCSITTHTCFRVDYSDRRFNDLDENGLNEAIGLQGGADNTDVSWARDPKGSGFIRVPSNGSPIDWNGDGAIESGVVEEINRDGQKTLLATQNDWETRTDSFGQTKFTHLLFSYQCSPNFSDGAPNQASGRTGFERVFREAWLKASNAQPAGSWMSNISVRIVNRPQTVPSGNPEQYWLKRERLWP